MVEGRSLHEKLRFQCGQKEAMQIQNHKKLRKNTVERHEKKTWKLTRRI